MHLLRTLVILASLSLLTACSSWVYKPDITQGNLVTQEMLVQVKPGMTKEQVRFILGTPMLVDTFHQNRWDYLYDFKPNSGKEKRYHAIVYFTKNVVQEVTTLTAPPLTEKHTD